jgi:hypothetical protein
MRLHPVFPYPPSRSNPVSCTTGGTRQRSSPRSYTMFLHANALGRRNLTSRHRLGTHAAARTSVNVNWQPNPSVVELFHDAR